MSVAWMPFMSTLSMFSSAVMPKMFWIRSAADTASGRAASATDGSVASTVMVTLVALTPELLEAMAVIVLSPGARDETVTSQVVAVG